MVKDSDSKHVSQELSEVDNNYHMSSREELGTLFDAIETRCKSAKIDCGLVKRDEIVRQIRIKLPAGRNTKELTIRDTGSATMLLNTPFEYMNCLSSYRAYFSYESGSIEAMIDTGRHTGLPSSFIYRRLQESLHRGKPREKRQSEPSRLQFAQEDERFQGITLTVGTATQEFSTLETLRLARSINLDRPFSPLTVRIEGLSISNHEQATSLLETIGNSALFQIDLLTGIPLYLAIETENEIRPRHLYGSGEKITLTFPKYQYNAKSMSLYWYASTARGMPLLQYLAYYQVIEFSFPAFANKATYDIVKRMLKDPAYHRDPDAHIGRLLNTLKPFVSKGGYGEERPSLLETIRNCVTDTELRAFFSENQERLEFFKSKSHIITSTKISVNSEKADIVSETANRIYEIRCKIVHTKSAEVGGQKELILPFSSQAQNLGFDIELIQFLARNVLVATATPLII